ncbi:MAG: sialate O-acetylesterase [Pirellulaceae bacterium]
MRASLAMAMFGLMWLPTLVRAELTLPAVFSDHMVLQRDKPVKIWGWATAGKEVTGRFASQQFATEADAEGRWTAILEPMKAGGPFSLTVAGDGSTAKVEDVYVGEVWLCSGQSNMAMTVNRAANFEQEAAAAKFPQIRMFKESSAHATEPQEKPAGSWTVCSPETVAGFSATAYFFGRELHQELGVPVGLVNSSVGGTSIESWTSMPAQVNAPGVQPRLQAWRSDDEAFDADAAQARYEQALKAWEKRRDAAKAAGTPIPRRPAQPTQPRQDRNYPSNLFNGKINPLVGYTIRARFGIKARTTRDAATLMFTSAASHADRRLANALGTRRFSVRLGSVAEFPSRAARAERDERLGVGAGSDAEDVGCATHGNGDHDRHRRSERYPSAQQAGRRQTVGVVGVARCV